MNKCKDCICCKPLMKHPLNVTPAFKGAISEQVAFCCTVMQYSDTECMIIMDDAEGECEMFMPYATIIIPDEIMPEEKL